MLEIVTQYGRSLLNMIPLITMWLRDMFMTFQQNEFRHHSKYEFFTVMVCF